MGMVKRLNGPLAHQGSAGQCSNWNKIWRTWIREFLASKPCYSSHDLQHIDNTILENSINITVFVCKKYYWCDQHGCGMKVASAWHLTTSSTSNCSIGCIDEENQNKDHSCFNFNDDILHLPSCLLVVEIKKKAIMRNMLKLSERSKMKMCRICTSMSRR